MTALHSLRLLCVLLAGVLSEPEPGRVPKVYNALITSNQNLEPSKAYPVYQPVLHDPFAFPFQPAVFYGSDFPLTNGLVPPPPAKPKQPSESPQPSPAPTENPEDAKSAEPSPSEEPSKPSEDGDKTVTPAPPSPPNTQSPIPLNQFGLPPQVLPLGRFDPSFDGFSQVGPFTYSYPGFRFYDPYDPFSFNPYANLPPLYRPLTNVLSQGPPIAVPKRPAAPAAPAPVPPQPADSESTPPPEPSDLNVLNYSSKDPAIPNVPPPPLPSGGLKSDESE